MDLRKMEDGEDWSPDCENLTASAASNRYSFSMRSVDKTGFAPRGPISLFDTSFGICKGSLSHLAPKNYLIKNFKAVKNELELLAAAVRALLQIWPKWTFREIGRRPPGGSLMVRVD